MDMAHRENQEERTTEPVDKITEKQFLKELYLFMKKRDTPIERIPNLGFKQIDLFVMFQTVQDLGGYHQVTAQQLWKQVYNRLGGNPRSTSAATCTRRHYEKLLLPYECHVKGVMMNILPHHESKNFPYANYSKDKDDGQRPAKRKLLSIPLHQNPQNLQPDPQGRVFPLHLHYPHYYHPSLAILPPPVPISCPVLTPHSPPAPQSPFSFQPYRLNPSDRVKEPLEQLRYLAEQYKTTSGLTEPLNLSVKASRQETNSNPASSFTPPSLSKNPKFLNKASPLYTPHGPQVVRNEGCETQDDEAGLGDTPYSFPGKAREAYVVDVNAITASSSPTYDSALTLRTEEGTTTMTQKPSSPKADFAIRPKEDRKGSPEVRGLTLSHVLPSLPRENGGKMEIEIPLSVFHSWLRLYGPSATKHDAQANQLPTLPALEENSGQRNYSDADILPTNLTFHMNSQHQSSAAEDLRLRKRNLPSPTLTTQTTLNNHNTSQIPFTSYKALPSSGIIKNAASRDVYLFDQQDFHKSYSTKSPNCWDTYDKETQALPIYPSSPIRVQQDFAVSKSYNEDTVPGGKEKSEMAPSGVLMVDSSSASLLHLTTEEIMKLKKIISSSS
ncbi:AT-rich interaction domain 6 [Micropterus dolomieu]|uniref:AT-rich interaction domain 6 n=1 Tax=Micropterus dolomieu TaxID=147949 RepID=UPI001E8E1989|nr:AT-rich interaction domain 6 [Micropterus dolomieu]